MYWLKRQKYHLYHKSTPSVRLKRKPMADMYQKYHFSCRVYIGGSTLYRFIKFSYISKST